MNWTNDMEVEPDSLEKIIETIVGTLLPMMWGRKRDESPAFYSALSNLMHVIEQGEIPNATDAQYDLLIQTFNELDARIYNMPIRRADNGDDKSTE